MAAVLIVAYAALSIWIPYHRERQIIQKIEGWGGRIEEAVLLFAGRIDEREKGGPEWLRLLLGDERMKAFDRVGIVDLEGSTITDVDLAELGGLTKLECLLLGGTAVTDAGLAHLSCLTNLKVLAVSDTAVTDAGLVHLSGMTSLEVLAVNDTAVTSAGVVHLSRLTKLEILCL